MSQASVLFGSETLPRVLAVLADQSGRGLSASEIAASLPAANRDSLYRALRRAIRAGVAKRTSAGGVALYQINVDSPIYPDLKSLLAKLLGIVAAIREALSGVAPPAIEVAFVFGSVASANDTHRSDVDVFVIGSASAIQLSKALRAVEASHGREINLVVYAREEIIAKLREGDPFVTNVWNGAKIFLVGEESLLPRPSAGDVAPQFLQEMRVGHYSQPYATTVLGGVPATGHELDDDSMDTVERWFRQLCPDATPRRSLPQVLWWQLDSDDPAREPRWQGWYHPGPVLAIRQIPALSSNASNGLSIQLVELVAWWREVLTTSTSTLSSLGVNQIRVGLTINTYGHPGQAITDIEFGRIPTPVAGAPPGQVSPWVFESSPLSLNQAPGRVLAAATRSLLRHFGYRRVEPVLQLLEVG